MNLYTFTVKRTPRGKYYCVVTIGKDVIYVSRKVYDSGEEAGTEAREYLQETRSAANEH
jgi:hypothetical protein